MAEGQSIKDRDFSQTPLDEEDPLMELSRIIGLEPRRDTAPRREPMPLEAAPEFHPEPVDVVEEPEVTAQPELSADLQQDLADELIARLEADTEFSLEADAEFSLEPEQASSQLEEPVFEVAAPELEAPVIEAQPVWSEPATPHIAVSNPVAPSLEDELEAILSPSMPRATPFGLRPVAEEIAAQELRAPAVDAHLDMNFDAEPAVEPVAEDDWQPQNAAPFEPVAIEPEAEVADEHYEAVEPYEPQEAPARSWPPVTVSAAAEESAPVLETVTHEPRSIEATDEFEVPEFEYEQEAPVSRAEDPLSGYDSGFEPVTYAKPVVAASTPVMEEAGRHQFNDADFDQINEAIAELEGERNQGASTIAAAGLGAAAAASARPARREFVLNESDEFAASLDVPHSAKPVLRQSSARSYLMAAGLGTLALVGGIAAYAWTRAPDTAGTVTAPVVLKADVEPVKIAPENPGGKVVPNQDIAVYDKVAGADQPAGEPQKVLVSKTEEPVDLAEKTAARVVLPGPSASEPASTDAAPETAPETAKAEDRVPVDTSDDASPAQAEIASVAAKKVRTMVVKSDGSLVERPAEEAKPVETASVETGAPDENLIKSMADAAVPATKVETKQIVATEEVGAVAKPAAPVVAAADPAPVTPEASAAAETPEAAVVEPEAPAKPVVKTVKTKKITQKQAKQEQPQEVAAATNIPLVDARPSDQPVNIVAKTGRTPANEAPAAEEVVATAPAAPSGGGGYVIQIASAPSSDQAQSTYASLNRKFGRIIGGRDMNIQKADIPGKGTFYRVRIAAGSKKEAAALCAKYKSAGGQCLVAR